MKKYTCFSLFLIFHWTQAALTLNRERNPCLHI